MKRSTEIAVHDRELDCAGQLARFFPGAAAVRVPAAHSVDAGELREQIAKRLSAYKVPRRFLLLSDAEVPLLASGKLDRVALEALFDVR